MILRIGNGTKIAAETVGTNPLRSPSGVRLDLKDCYYVSVANQNLISMSVLAQEGFEICFNKDFCSIYLRNKLITQGLLIDSLYHLHVDANVNLNEQIVSAVGQKRSKDEINQKYLWHHRLGHIGEDRINKLEKDAILGSLNPESYLACKSCLREKMAKLSFVGHGERTTELLILVHNDMYGPFDIQIKGGYTYFIIFIDDLSRYGYVYLMKHKSEASEKFKKFKHKVEK